MFYLANFMTSAGDSFLSPTNAMINAVGNLERTLALIFSIF